VQHGVSKDEGGHSAPAAILRDAPLRGAPQDEEKSYAAAFSAKLSSPNSRAALVENILRMSASE
jgi:hypothetical protein